jgi:hypothetical protein
MARPPRTLLKVLKCWDALRRTPEAQAMSPRAFRLLTGIAMEWDGHNNAAIIFTRGEHGTAVGLGHPETFDGALAEVLESKLIVRTRKGGPNRPAKYAIAIEPFQMDPEKAPRRRRAKKRISISTDSVPIVSTDSVPIDPQTGTNSVPSRYEIRTNNFSPHNKNARARARASEIKITETEKCTQVEIEANPDAGQGENATQTPAPISKLRAVH